jgi:uncharacterized damage-inducible protein DinB
MKQVARWFDRRFDFSFPVELYPNLLMRLRGAPPRLEDVVKGSTDRMLRSPEGKWSAQEHAGHLADLEPLWMARVEDFVAGRNELKVADLTNRPTFEARHNSRPLQEILAEFRRARQKLTECVEKLEPASFGRAIPHPRLKVPMRLIDHLFFVAEHDDHHLAIIWEMIRD